MNRTSLQNEGHHAGGLKPIALTTLTVPASYYFVERNTNMEIPIEAYNVALLYRQFAQDLQDGTHVAPDFYSAIKLHECLEHIRQTAYYRKTIDAKTI